jgi:hypothetical protein
VFSPAAVCPFFLIRLTARIKQDTVIIRNKSAAAKNILFFSETARKILAPVMKAKSVPEIS